MRLLVSVRSGDEAASALSGGADIIDAKDPLAGALGAVSIDVLREIVATVRELGSDPGEGGTQILNPESPRHRGQTPVTPRHGGLTPVSAALGDGADEATLADAAARFATAGADLVKVGFARIGSPDTIETLLRAAARGAGRQRVVAVAYADHLAAGALAPSAIAAIAARAGVAGILMDTAIKNGAGLRALISADALASWTSAARRAGLFVALAGQLREDDLPAIARTGAEVVGVRGAACDSGRAGRVAIARVRALRTRLDGSAGDRMER